MTSRAPAFLVVSIAVHAAALLALVGRTAATQVDDAPRGERPDLGGETFELPAPETFEPAAGEAPPPSDAPAADDAPAIERKPARPAAPRAPGTSSPGSATAGAASTTALYGALGDRSATDLAAAFTRGFPQAASADPLWRSAPLGFAGRVTLVLDLDEDGHIARAEVNGTPSGALASAIRRTLALLGSRPFVARGRTTRLTLAARISADEVHDGLHGDVFAIGGSFAGSSGQAFFALAIGRRVDLSVAELAASARNATAPPGR